MPRAICEDCGSLVEAELTHNGVCQVGHYVHCGWGHQLSPDDLISDAAAIEILTEQLEAARADAKEAEAYAEELKRGKALRRISPSDLHAVFVRRDEWAYVSPMDEGNCVTLDGDFNFSQIAEDINATLAKIEGEKT